MNNLKYTKFIAKTKQLTSYSKILSANTPTVNKRKYSSSADYYRVEQINAIQNERNGFWRQANKKQPLQYKPHLLQRPKRRPNLVELNINR